jgi:hypothetical protein
VYNILVRKIECRHHLEDNNCRWEGNIKVDPKELGWDGVVWVCVALCGPVIGSYSMLMTLNFRKKC